MKEYEVLCCYLKKNNWNEDGSPTDDSDYFIIVRVNADNKEKVEQAILNDFAMFEDTEEAKELFQTDEYVEGTFEAVQILSEHEIR